MDDDQNRPAPPHPDEVAALAAQSTPAMPIPGDTLPARPLPARPTPQGAPPESGPPPGQVMPPPPQTEGESTPPALAQPSSDPGLQRAVENINLDAVAQADPQAHPDRHSAEALIDIVDGGTMLVPVNSIDRELIQIWKSTTSGGDNEGKVQITLMRALNLVVYVEDDDRAHAANEVITRIIGRHPCRTIMIANQSGASPAAPNAAAASASDDGDLQALLSAHCQTADASGKRICCEQVSVLAKSVPALSRVSNVALNLLITDLPVFLWWAAGMPFNNAVLAHLEHSIDRLIVDSAAFPDPMPGLLAMARAVDPAFRQSDGPRYAPGDLNWDRLAGWREATAQMFDAPELAGSLWRIGSVEVRYAAPAEGQTANPAQAFLLAAWLASRLNWEFHAAAPANQRNPTGDLVLTVRQGVRSIPLLLRAVPGPAACAGGLIAIQVTTNDANPLTLSLQASDDQMFVDCTVQREGQPPTTRKVRYNQPDEAGLLDTEMELFGHDPIYDAALVMAGTMAWGSLPFGRRAEISARLESAGRQSSFDPRF